MVHSDTKNWTWLKRLSMHAPFLLVAPSWRILQFHIQNWPGSCISRMEACNQTVDNETWRNYLSSLKAIVTLCLTILGRAMKECTARSSCSQWSRWAAHWSWRRERVGEAGIWFPTWSVKLLLEAPTSISCDMSQHIQWHINHKKEQNWVICRDMDEPRLSCRMK